LKSKDIDEKRNALDKVGHQILKEFPMTSIPFLTFLNIIFVLVDDWYQAEGVSLLRRKPGRNLNFRIVRYDLDVSAKITS